MTPEAHAMRILTEQAVLEIKQRLADYRPGLPAELAIEFGVKPVTIRAIQYGYNWGWLKEGAA